MLWEDWALGLGALGLGFWVQLVWEYSCALIRIKPPAPLRMNAPVAYDGSVLQYGKHLL